MHAMGAIEAVHAMHALEKPRRGHARLRDNAWTPWMLEDALWALQSPPAGTAQRPVPPLDRPAGAARGASYFFYYYYYYYYY